MATEQQIVVRGAAERTAPADLAAIQVAVQVDDTDQAAAFRRASDLAAAVDAVLAERADALGPRQAATVVVQPTTRWVDGEAQRTGWRASRSNSLDVTALDQLSPLLAELVAAGAVVHGPAWRLRPDYPVHAEARTAAAVDARARAESYAAGLGLRVGRVEWVAEPGLRVAPGDVFDVAGRGAGMALAHADVGDPELAVEAAELTVRATVEVAFGIER